MPLRSAFFWRMWKITSCFRIVPKFSIPISLAIWLSSVIDIAWSLAMLSEEAMASLVGAAGSALSSSGDSTAWVGGSSSMVSEREFSVVPGSPLAVGHSGLLFDLAALGSAAFLVL